MALVAAVQFRYLVPLRNETSYVQILPLATTPPAGPGWEPLTHGREAAVVASDLLLQPFFGDSFFSPGSYKFWLFLF